VEEVSRQIVEVFAEWLVMWIVEECCDANEADFEPFASGSGYFAVGVASESECDDPTALLAFSPDSGLEGVHDGALHVIDLLDLNR